MTYQRIVVKLGTSSLTGGTNRISQPHMLNLVQQIVRLHQKDTGVVLVSSGAMAAGREALHYPDLPGFIPAKQMLAAIGQPLLMTQYERFFGIYSVPVAQVLLTREDITDRSRYLNARNTLEALLSQKVIPIINENDTVATEEIRFGDNDNLSALVATLVEADLLVLLTDQPGLFTADPRRDSNARLVQRITTPDIPEELWEAAGGSSTGLGIGGMVTKLQAANLARRAGTTVMIAFAGEPDVLQRILAGEPLGTVFEPTLSTLESRKRFILSSLRTSDALTIDPGAVSALKQGGSLLPVGLKSVAGDFNRGDAVRVISKTGKDVAIGLVNYASRDLAAICGRHSNEIETLLGFTFGDEVIHRDNLLLL